MASTTAAAAAAAAARSSTGGGTVGGGTVGGAVGGGGTSGGGGGTGRRPRQIDASQLPSVLAGMSEKEEALKRRKTCRFIEEVGRVLKLPRVSVATAMVFFHRFYAKHSFQEHERFEVAIASILLAAKTEESPKKLHVVISEALKVKARGMQAGRISQPPPGSGGSNGAAVSPTSAGTIDPKSEEFNKLKERILLLERIILHTIGFELSIDHPYKFLVDMCKRLVHKRQIEYVNPEDRAGTGGGGVGAGGGASTSSSAHMYGQMLNRMVQYSMNFANDSMQTSLCLQFEPEVIATACVYLAGQFAKVRPTGGASWLEILGHPDVESFACIALQIIELVSDRKGTDEAMFTKIRTDIELLKSKGDGGGGGGSAQPPDAKRQRTS